ncbi:glucose 1-dehydrogenase [Leptolyngbya sp. NIES-2104]|uniref:glucose 1-dehydrogenase n=1 Tax=Leptolyngbya sp. NIES-2104 TaxID=1552121 RepID=UPI0006EC531C|nr:glucose 1-dehydrogenase [Leptolyngbya sp. NIES-2104]GAP94099.1 3-oxoacyl-[acyl-carrier protein] reductase [Leptolyngbya sp. NIES-2104]
MENGKLNGKVAIVTGSSRGIGRAIAERLGQDGAKVVVTYVGNQDKAEEVVSAIKANGSDAVAIKVDMRQVADVRNLFQKTIAQFGQIDILVNNAAGKNIFQPTAELSEEEYNSMFDITRGVYFSLQEASHHMANGGRIVNMSSSATAMAYPTGGAYAGCKAAIEQFSVCLAKELGVKGIVVNMVSPGLTATDGLVLEQQEVEQMVAQTPLGRLRQPDDIASAVAMLVSDDAHWVTGQNLRATGGMV